MKIPPILRRTRKLIPRISKYLGSRLRVKRIRYRYKQAIKKSDKKKFLSAYNRLIKTLKIGEKLKIQNPLILLIIGIEDFFETQI